MAAVVGLSLLAGCSAGCGVGGDDDEGVQTLTVFAAASLTSAFTEIAGDLEQADPGIRVRLSFDGSSGLVDQIAGGAPSDVLASADTRTMDRAVEQGLIAGEPTLFATNELTLITPPGNPAGVTGLDASLEGTRLVVCAEAVPCGSAARDLAATAGIALRPVSEEVSVSDVRGKVVSGEADAGIVYATDAAAAGDRVERVAIAGAATRPNRYPIAVLARAADPALAQSFIDAVVAAEGRSVLTAAGFGPP